ncbi:UNVERIFIED_CONTAM: hypothetical protein PYX00_007332 [Menopon gallinae]|uniref:F-box domain-containing protein n=1 Tax=Menopon gallinae TaxID=328185 RepID=A0AAW2HID1_9NEOP
MATSGMKIETGMQKEEFSASLEKIVEESMRKNGNWGLLQNDILFAATFWLMRDCGFAVHESQNEGLPESWKHGTKELYEANFILPPYKDHLVRLVALPADDILCINVFVSNVPHGNVCLKSLALSSSGFVPRPEANQVLSKFSNLEYMSVYLRSALIWPIRCAILTDKGVVNGSLTGLSDEIKLKIIHFLGLQDLLSLSETCHDLNRVCNDPKLWKTMFHRRFQSVCKCSGKSECAESDTQWKENYKHFHKLNNPVKNSQEASLESFHTATESTYYEVDLSYEAAEYATDVDR